ncbi:MAG: hypothetical protein ACI4SG_03155 [Oligosphaeraceae bacterium]
MRDLPSRLIRPLFRGLAILASALIVSCRTLTAPPGYVSRGSGTAGRIEFPEEVSLEAQYALLAWYGEQYGQEARLRAGEAFGLVHNALNDRALLLRGMAAQALVGRYPGFAYIPPQGGVAFLYESLGERKDFPEMEAMLERCRQTLEARRYLEIPVQECKRFLAQTTNGDESSLFALWASRNPRLEIDFPDEQNLRLLERCRQAVVLKAHLVETMDFVRAHLQEGARAEEVLAQLDQRAREMPPQADLGVLGDTETLPQWEKLLEEAPGALVEAAVTLWHGDNGEEYEEVMSLAMGQWDKDFRLQKASRELWETMRRNLDEAFQARKDALARECAEAAERGDFAREIRRLRRRAGELASGNAGAWECYARLGRTEELAALLKESAESLIPGACQFYLARQKECLREGRPASALALDEILRELAGAEVDASVPVASQAREELSSLPAAYGIWLGEFTGGEPGQGASWRRDLGFALSEALGRWKGGALLRLESREDVPGAMWRLAQGELLEYEPGEVEIQRRTEVRRHYGEARLEEGGDYAFLQPLWRQEVEVVQASRVGHVRLRGILQCGELACPLEVNTFCPRTFCQENLLSSQTQEILRCQDQRQLKPVTPQEPLRQDRIWSAGEMLDYTRQNALEEFLRCLMASLLENIPRELSLRSLPVKERAETLLRMTWLLDSLDLSRDAALDALRRQGRELLNQEGRDALLEECLANPLSP